MKRYIALSVLVLAFWQVVAVARDNCIDCQVTSLTKESEKQSDSVNYYYGKVKFSTPDGRPAGENISLAKRTISPGEGRIVEIVIQPSRRQGSPASEVVTTMNRIGNTDVFSAEDNWKSFNGKITFSGEAWKWNHWSYDIKFTSGDEIRGEGFLDDSSVKTKKIFYKNGRINFLIEEELKKITEEEYRKKHSEISGT